LAELDPKVFNRIADFMPLSCTHGPNMNEIKRPDSYHTGRNDSDLRHPGIVCCIIFGILAWVMGGGDLKEMAEGRMDPSGEGLTKAGKILGIVGCVLAILGLIIGLATGALGALAGLRGALN
jgi:hypothetical protein